MMPGARGIDIFCQFDHELMLPVSSVCSNRTWDTHLGIFANMLILKLHLVCEELIAALSNCLPCPQYKLQHLNSPAA